MTSGYFVDASDWPDRLDILFNRTAVATRWLGLHELPEAVAEGLVYLDLDAFGRCCGLEIWDVTMIAPQELRASDPEGASPSGRPQLVPPSAVGDDALSDWSRAILYLGGLGDPHLSLHWHSRRTYDYSAELDELSEEGNDWVQIGLDPDELLVGIRFVEARQHLVLQTSPLERLRQVRRRLPGEVRSVITAIVDDVQSVVERLRG